MAKATKESLCLRCGHKRVLVKSHILPKWAVKRLRDPDLAHRIIRMDGEISTVTQDLPKPKRILCGECENYFSDLDREAYKLFAHPTTARQNAWQQGKPALLRGTDYLTAIHFTAFICWKYIADLESQASLPSPLSSHEDILKWDIKISRIQNNWPPSCPVDFADTILSPSIETLPDWELPLIRFALAGFEFFAGPCRESQASLQDRSKTTCQNDFIEIAADSKAAKRMFDDLRQRGLTAYVTKSVLKLMNDYNAQQHPRRIR